MEFKRKAADPVKIMREVVAFANKSGGRLLIGIADDGTIAGLEHPDDEAYVLQNAIAAHCRPGVGYEMARIKLNLKKEVLVFDIFESPVKPVYLIYNLKRGSGRAYIRAGDKSVQASREVRKILKARQATEGRAFAYGENERALIRLISQTGSTSLKAFMQAAALPEETASDVLVSLAVSNVLEVIPADGQDVFVLKTPL